MDQLFQYITHAVQGAPIIALVVAFVWGILSVLLSPCHLASIPLIIGYIAGQKEMTARKAFWMSSSFAFGILVTIGLLGVVTVAVGRLAGDIGDIAYYIVAGVFFLVGLHLVGVIPMPVSGPGQITIQRKGFLAAFVLGLVFGIALGPCTFGYLAVIVGGTLLAGKSASLQDIGLLTSYGIGHSAIIALAGTSVEMVQRYLHWQESTKGMRYVKVACGILVMLGGLYLLSKTH